VYGLIVAAQDIQRGDIVFPRSRDRMRSNFARFDFELGDSDMDAISALDHGESGRTGPNPDMFDYIPGSASTFMSRLPSDAIAAASEQEGVSPVGIEADGRRGIVDLCVAG
jgi:hypothetical protein